MSLVGKLSAEILIVAPHHEHYGVWSRRPHHISNVSPGKIKKAHLHEGDWGNVGSVIEWHYVIGEPTLTPHHHFNFFFYVSGIYDNTILINMRYLIGT